MHRLYSLDLYVTYSVDSMKGPVCISLIRVGKKT